MTQPVLGNQTYNHIQNVANAGFSNILVNSIYSTTSSSGATSLGFETITTANDGDSVNLDVTVTLFDSTDGPFTVTLGDGKYPGQVKFFACIDSVEDGVLSIQKMYVLANPGPYNITLRNDVPLQLFWNNSKWVGLSDFRYYD